MNCQNCQELIQQRLDGLEVAAALEMKHHLTECGRCAKLQAASLRLNAGLLGLRPPLPPADLAGRIVAGVLNDLEAERKRKRRRVALFALAASLLLGTTAIGLYYSDALIKGGSPAQQPVVVDHAPPLDDDSERSAPAVSVRGTVTEAGNALAALTTRTADETVGQSRLLVPVMTGPTFGELDMQPVLEPTKPYLEAGQGVAFALEPVTQSARRAVDLFRHDLPHMDSESLP